MSDAQQPIELTPTAALWQQRIKEWEASGLTQAAFCQQHNLSHHSLKKWRYLLSANATHSKRLRLVPIDLATDHKVTEAPIRQQPKAITVHVDALRLDVPKDFDSDHLTKLVRTLQGV